MFWVKNLKNFHLSILGKTGQKNTFHDIVEGGKGPSFYLRQNKPGKCVSRYSTILFSNDILQREYALLDYKNKNLIKSKNKHSFKGVGPCFWSKISNFSILYLWENSPGICLS